MKEIEINGVVSVPESETDFWGKFVAFCESNGWSFGGGVVE